MSLLPDTTAPPAIQQPPPSGRADLFGVQIDQVTLPEAIGRVILWAKSPADYAACRYVVTPNVDHVLQLQDNEPFREAYGAASLVLADGWPLVTVSRWAGQPLPERVAGSDLVPGLFAAAADVGGLRVFLLGGMPGVGLRAAERCQDRWPGVHIAGVSSPPLGFEKDEAACLALCEEISAAEPELLIVGLGAPKQELWLQRWRQQIGAPVAIAAGATIDFLAGEQQRAPVWVQQLRAEWIHRALSDPRRLGPRYARGLVRFPLLATAEVMRRRSHGTRRKGPK